MRFFLTVLTLLVCASPDSLQGQSSLSAALKDSVIGITEDGYKQLWTPPLPSGSATDLEVAVLQCLNGHVWDRIISKNQDTPDQIPKATARLLLEPNDHQYLLLECAVWTSNVNNHAVHGYSITISKLDKGNAANHDTPSTSQQMMCKLISQSCDALGSFDEVEPISEEALVNVNLRITTEGSEVFAFRDDVYWHGPHSLRSLTKQLEASGLDLQHRFSGEMHHIWVE